MRSDVYVRLWSASQQVACGLQGAEAGAMRVHIAGDMVEDARDFTYSHGLRCAVAVI